jgi:hypothetical protein
VIELGRIEVNIMDCIAMPLDVGKWKAMKGMVGREASPAVNLIIDHVSLDIWKQKLIPSFDLHEL